MKFSYRCIVEVGKILYLIRDAIMQTCVQCNHQNSDRELFCSNCDRPLFARSLQTMIRPTEEMQIVSEDIAIGVYAILTRSNMVFFADGKFHFEPISHRVYIGRDKRQLPTAELGATFVDLTPYSGHLYGVSRLHARIDVNERNCEIVDLRSTNGIQVNGRRLVPYQPYPLNDNDRIWLGNYRINVRYQMTSTTLSSETSKQRISTTT